MLRFKAFAAAQDTLVGIELMHMIKKKQLRVETGDEGLTVAELFYSLAASSPHRQGSLPLQDHLRKICDTTRHRPPAPTAHAAPGMPSLPPVPLSATLVYRSNQCRRRPR